MLAGFAAADAPQPPAKTPAAKEKKSPVPGYEWRTMEGFQVLINKKCLSEVERASGQYEIPPLEVLENEFKALNQILLPKLLKVLQGVTIWVEWDDLPPAAPGTAQDAGGRTVAVYRYGSGAAGARSFQAGRLSHPGKMNAVEVMSLKELTEVHQPGRHKVDQIVLLHELCHTVHFVFMGADNADALTAYRSAMERELYPKAYARTNEHEYFAEISCAYLDRCIYTPHTADELKDYDPLGYKLCEKIWGKQDMIAKARARAAAERELRARYRRPAAAAGSKAANPTSESKTDPEKAASQKLEFAKDLLKDGKTAKAKEWLQNLIHAYPGTKAAGEAEKMLGSL
jgi:hypothetical protein